jgi:hypothetical protein
MATYIEPLPVTRTPHQLLPDPKRVIAKPFLLGTDVLVNGEPRLKAALDRILAIPEEQIPAMLEEISRHFSARHRDFEGMLDKHFQVVSERLLHCSEPLSRERRLLIGAYCSHEYSIEAAALCNPSIVPAPDQSGLPKGSSRFIMSLRAIGEGHISSIEFRSGEIEQDGRITVDSMSPFASTGERLPNPAYHKEVFESKLRELSLDNPVSQWILDRLADRFNLEELMGVVAQSKNQAAPARLKREAIEVFTQLGDLRARDFSRQPHGEPRGGGCALRPICR